MTERRQRRLLQVAGPGEPASVFLVVCEVGVLAAHYDFARADRIAAEVGGVVAAVPIVTDHRR